MDYTWIKNKDYIKLKYRKFFMEQAFELNIDLTEKILKVSHGLEKSPFPHFHLGELPVKITNHQCLFWGQTKLVTV